MKSIFFLLITFSLNTLLNAQEYGVTKKFFTGKNFRVAVALGADLSWASEEGGTRLVNNIGTIADDNIDYAKSPNRTFFIGLDLYSPTSTLGFITGAGLNLQEYSVQTITGITTDSLSVTNIEVPLYLKLRFGNALSRSQFWLAAGGGYSITTKATSVQTNNTNTFLSKEVDIKKQFKATPFLSAMLGYEFMAGNAEDEINRDTFRFLLYGKVNYDLGNRIDPENLISNSTFAAYQDPSLQFVRISLGIKILMRLGKAGEVIYEQLTDK